MKTKLKKLTEQKLDEIISRTKSNRKTISNQLKDTDYKEFAFIKADIPAELKRFAEEEICISNKILEFLIGNCDHDFREELNKIFVSCYYECKYLIINKENQQEAIDYINNFFFSDEVEEELEKSFKELDYKLSINLIDNEEYEILRLTHKLQFIISDTNKIIDFSKPSFDAEQIILNNEKNDNELIASAWSYGVNLWIDHLNEQYKGLLKFNHVTTQTDLDNVKDYQNPPQLKCNRLGFTRGSYIWENKFVINLTATLKDGSEEQFFLEHNILWKSEMNYNYCDNYYWTFTEKSFKCLIIDFDHKLIKELEQL